MTHTPEHKSLRDPKALSASAATIGKPQKGATQLISISYLSSTTVLYCGH